MQRKLPVVALGASLTLLAGSLVSAQRLPVRRHTDDLRSPAVRLMPGLRPSEHLLFNGWGLTPAGRHEPASDMPLKLVLSPDGQYLAAAHGGFNGTGLTLLHAAEKRVTQFVPLKQAWNGVAFQQDGKRLFVGGGASGLIHAFSHQNGRVVEEKSLAPAGPGESAFVAGLAVHPRTGRLYACNEAGHEVWVIDPHSLKREAVIPVGAHPHSCAFGADGRHLYVSNWGNRTVSVVDTARGRRVNEIPVGIRPNDLVVARDGRLFVACAGDNTVHVIPTRKEMIVRGGAVTLPRPDGVEEILSTSLYPASPEGSTPVGVAVSPDGGTLYVANADNNNVLVADISDRRRTRTQGFIPVGWYPTALAVSPTGTLIVANGKGLTSRENYPARTPDPVRLPRPPVFDAPGRQFQGSLSFIAPPSASHLAEYTEQVRRNTPYTPEMLTKAPVRSDSVIPDTALAAGTTPCPIKYVLYVVKENRSYDQVFGDFRNARGKKAGNGAAELVMFGEEVAPNHHALAREYVLLDNLYSNAEVSRDGHSWATGALATDYTQRAWMMAYSGRGSLPGNPELATPSAGFIWDQCRRNGTPYRCYGELGAGVPNSQRGTWAAGRDMDRVQGWIQDLEAAEKSGELPRLMVMSLREDHTSGTTPGKPTPEACVASNDIALGRIVAAASRSRFWKEMAIFVVEDDAQNGPDHVDSHRIPGLVISPWAKRGVVDSTHYTTAGVLRTMELILGLPPMTQYDAAATPLFRSFRGTAPGPKATQYVPLVPKVDVHAVNPANAP